MLHKLFTTLLSCLLFTCSFAQVPGNYEKVWTFGTGARIDFNGPVPVASTSSIHSQEAAASICNPSGQLIFYTDGSNVWSSNDALMPNGSDLTGFGQYGTFSTTQGAIIVPVPGSPQKFYIFSITPFELTGVSGKLYRSMVDMSLNGGMGDVMASEKGILVDTGFSEKMSAVVDACNNRILLITFSTFPQGVKTFEISSSGFNATPVFTPFGLFNDPERYLTGAMCVSPDQHKVVTCNQAIYVFGIGSLELCDFNTATGTVSNNILVDTGSYYGCCFSQDNTKLYANCPYFDGVTVTYRIYQFDITNANPASTKTLIGTIATITQMKLAPNGKIYFAPGFWGQNNLGSIDNPNLSGSACGFVLNALAFAPGSSGIFGLPNKVPWLDAAAVTDTIFTHQSYTPCFEVKATIQSQNQSTDSKYKWNTGDTTRTIPVITAGTYWVKYNGPSCKYHVDTFHVNAPLYHLPTVQAFAACLHADPAAILAIPFAGDTYNYTYTWLNSSNNIIKGPLQSNTGDMLLNAPAGLYHLKIKASNDCDTTIDIEVPEATVSFPDVTVSDDSVLCSGIKYMLTALSQNEVTYLWSTGSVTSTTSVSISGNYWVTAYYENCKKTDTVSVTFKDCSCRFFIPNAFSPNQDGINDIFLPRAAPDCSVGSYSLRIFNRWGELVFNSNKPDQGWDGYVNNKPSDAGVYWYYLTYENVSDQEKKTMKGDLLLLR